MDKDFSCIGVWSNGDHPCQNYGPSNLLFRFTDSYIFLPNLMQKKISIITLISITSIKSQFLKPTVRLILTWKIEAFLSIQNGGSFIFRKICKKYLLLGRYVLTLLGLHEVFAFINIRNFRQRQRSSDKFRLHKRFLYNKGPTTSSFSVFSLFQF